MTRALTEQPREARTHEGAAAYDYSQSHPLIHLTFTMGSALFTDGFYETAGAQLKRYRDALLAAARVEARFPWQYAAWMRDITRGKGNRIQGSLAPALLDAALGETPFTEAYVTQCLSHRADDVAAFLTHYERLDLGRPSPAARRGMARALTRFDEYQLMKYARRQEQVRLCDAILFVRAELEALGEEGGLVLRVGEYLHAPTRARAEKAEGLPLTGARRDLWRRAPEYALSDAFPEHVRRARVTWEQLYGHFGRKVDAAGEEARAVNQRLWRTLLDTPGLLGDMALLRNLRNMRQSGIPTRELRQRIAARPMRGIWPQQIYAGFMIEPKLERVFEEAFAKVTAQLPPGRHLGIGDASGSMMVPVGGNKGTLKAMDVAFCLVGLMSETSGLGASFSDDGFKSWSGGSYLSIAKRGEEGALAFSRRADVRKGMGGTQVFGAVMELIEWLEAHPEVEPPECLWFFSDMQFHPSAGTIPKDLRRALKAGGVEISKGAAPLEAALALYRRRFGAVDVVLWNLAAYSPTPVPAGMANVLLVSGFDANTLRSVGAWREGKAAPQPVEEAQEVILALIRSF